MRTGGHHLSLPGGGSKQTCVRWAKGGAFTLYDAFEWSISEVFLKYFGEVGPDRGILDDPDYVCC